MSSQYTSGNDDVITRVSGAFSIGLKVHSQVFMLSQQLRGVPFNEANVKWIAFTCPRGEPTD